VNGTISSLTRQVDKKDAELSQEKETVRILSEKIEDLRAATNGFEALIAQNRELMGKLDQQNAQNDEQKKKTEEETWTK
jgi:chromosome segregation ATPase